jgi:hypothetical protein
MNRKTTHVLHLLLTVLVVLTGVLPVTPALAATPIEDTAPRTSPAPPQSPPILGGKQDRGEYTAPAAPAQAPEAIDPGNWDQDYPSAAGDSAGNLYAVWQDYREGTVPHIRFAYRPVDGGWQTSVKLDPTAVHSRGGAGLNLGSAPHS